MYKNIYLTNMCSMSIITFIAISAIFLHMSNNGCDTVTEHPFTSTYLMSPVTSKDDQITYTWWTTPSVTIARHLSVNVYFHLRMAMAPKSEADI